MKKTAWLLVAAVLAGMIFAGCANITATNTPPLPESQQTPSTPTMIGGPPAPGPDYRLEIIYFHTPWRCETCLCWEEQITYVVNTYFADEIKDGKITYQVLDVGDYKNNDMARKYGTSSSQLFINRIVNGKDNIKFIQDLYRWGCLTNKKAFDNAVKEEIEKSLIGL